jgi:hypothetical protein
MNRFKWMKEAVARWTSVAFCALLCGCGTLLVHVGEFSDDHVAYLVKGALGQIDEQQEIAKRIAGQELTRRLDEAKVADDSRNLGLWRNCLDALEAPIAIEADRVDRASELRAVSDRDRVTSYVKTHPNLLSLEGAAYSEEWKQRLAQAKERVEKLSAEYQQYIKQADVATGARDYLKVLMALTGALEITPGDKDLVARRGQATANGWKAAKEAMETNVIKKAPALMANPAVTTQQLDDFEKGALAQQNAMFDFIRFMTSARGDKLWLNDERRKEMGTLFQHFGEVLGSLWEKNAAILVGRSDFWAAYKYLAARIASAQTQPALKYGNLATKAKSLYAGHLVAGMTHYIDAAGAAYNRDQYGLSYVYCLMAEEMYDYALTQRAPLPSDAATRLEFARSIEKDDVEKIAAQHNRRLIILDFLPAVTEEGGQVAYQGRTLCNKKYALPNSLAWRLSVPQGKTLTPNMVEPIDPADTIISGEIKEITINAVPVREYDQQFVEVGSDKIIEIVNPMYKIHENQPRTIWQQEVAKFYQVKREHRKEGVLSLLLYGERPGQPPATLLTLNENFPSPILPLTNLSMKCEEISFANPISGAPRTAALREDLVADPYPQSVPVRLASDKEITKAVLDFALSKMDTAIENLVAQYPITKLAEPAVTAQKNGDHALCAELWGQFLLYGRKLTEPPLSDAERESILWTALRRRIEKNLSDWSTSRWKERNEAALKGVADLWANATREALLARGEGTGD